MNSRRRDFLKTAYAALASAGALPIVKGCGRKESELESRQPNVIFVLTDDQGYGDVGYHGNDVIKTPNIDRFASDSIDFTRFYAAPICAPTRAGLLTGRYHYRTGVTGATSGTALMHPDEVTIAEMFGEAGYRTGIFGKWHLGDNYPRRSIDQGFQESLVFNGGGIAHLANPPGGTSHFDPILQHNGKPEKHKGYCTDIYFNAAFSFIKQRRDKPFFAYISTNAPHVPLTVADDYLNPYLAMGLDERTARVYAMITNIDDNFGRLIEFLREMDLEKNTILIFMGDNGSDNRPPRYNSGLRGRKSTVYEGGIRVPFIIRWPDMLTADRRIDDIAAYTDVLPTLLDACGIEKPAGVPLDGMNLMPLLSGKDANWPERLLFIQTGGAVPQLYRNCTVFNQRYKLINGKELYDIIEDSSEKHDIAANHPEVIAQMRSQYETWFEDVSSTRGYESQRIYLGTLYENPVTLSPNDWKGPRSWWRSNKYPLGYWDVDIRNTGKYEITLRFREMEVPGTAHLTIGAVSVSQALEKGETFWTSDALVLEAGESRLDAWLEIQGSTYGVNYVDVRWLE